MRTVVELQLQATNTNFEGQQRFEFDDPTRSFYPGIKTIFDAPVNDDGRANFSKKLVDNITPPGKIKAVFKTRAFEKGGDFSTDSYSIDYSPYDSYAGVDIPENQYGQQRLEIDQDGTIDMITVDENGRGLANRELSVNLYRVEWRWWWERGRNSNSRYNSDSNLKSLQQTTLTTDSKGQSSWTTKVDRWGRYLIRVCDSRSGHCSGDYFYAGYPWYDSEGGNRDAAAILPFSSDKENYEVGETVSLKIPTG